ncbi:MAG: DNA gyrase inhibitor YacG [Deltaproteobacteria bacterium]|nr:DNA gyrase inhibitor YacG [Deltaproteobacteria bacterium]
MCCPRCRKVIEQAPPDHAARPFCSPNCKLADLGDWLGEAYRIAGPEVTLGDAECAPGGAGGRSPSG